ncbi:hypothetical protein AGOR_G00025930 [Albula goreensis]|uniref:Zona pellucida sperm-binding protein 3 n=1 Tax=Albula goreensis TaxID=1534307 RepID=A0A8T3E5Q5_9TELE|nr:hypothetical protein AGOR_G00025930 [Albula goreensis]
MEGAVIPVECHYDRRYAVSSSVLNPTWIPFISTQTSDDVLDFSLKLMTSNWHSERATDIYFVGDIIYIEASFIVNNHMPLRLFVTSCVATMVPDKSSVSRYAFIDNDGCLTNSRLTSSKSRFLPRVQDDKLQIQLEAFRFHNDIRRVLYVTCHLKAIPVMYNVDSLNRACSFISGRWRSVDGSDQICDSCETAQRLGKQTASDHQLEKEVSLHPVEILSEKTSDMGPRSRKMESGHGEDPWMSEISPDKEEGGSLEDDLAEHSASMPMEFDDMDADEDWEKETFHDNAGHRPANEDASLVLDEQKEFKMETTPGTLTSTEEDDSLDVLFAEHDGLEKDTFLDPLISLNSGNANAWPLSGEAHNRSVVTPSMDLATSAVSPSTDEITLAPQSKDAFSPGLPAGKGDDGSEVPHGNEMADTTVLLTQGGSEN